MLFKEAVKGILKEKGMAQEEGAIAAGFAGQGGLSSAMSKPNITLESAMRILNALGYTLAIVKQDEVNLSFLELPENARRKPGT